MPYGEHLPNWYHLPSIPPAESVVVVGAGLAGASSAYHLASLGLKVTVIEAQEAPAMAGSGNPQGMLYLKLSAHGTEQTELLLEAFAYLRELLDQFTEQGLLIKGVDWDACGLLQLAYSAREAKRQGALDAAFPDTLLRQVTQEEASALAGYPLTSGGLYFPTAGWVAPKALTAALLSHPNIEVRCSEEVVDLQHDAQGAWLLTLKKGEMLQKMGTPLLILATAEKTATFPLLEKLPLHKSRGQITTIEGNLSPTLRCVVSGEGYIAPPLNNRYTFGATFRVEADNLQPTKEEEQENLSMLAANSPQLKAALLSGAKRISGRAAYRSNAKGYLPLIGPIAHREQFLERFAILRKDARAEPDLPVPWLKGLYLNIAHGARGLLTAPYGGLMLANYIMGPKEVARSLPFGGMFPVKPSLQAACHPNRFYFQHLRFNYPD